MGIGGGIITKKLLFAALLISSLFLSGIAGVSATDAETAEIQSDNSSTVQEKADIEINNTDNVDKSATTQNPADESVKTVKNTGTPKASTKTNQTTTETESTTQDTVSTDVDKTTESQTVPSTDSASQDSTDTETKDVDQTANAENSVPTSPDTANNTTNTQEKLAAAGETKTPASFTVSQINDAAARVKAFIETNKRLPKYVTIGTSQVTMPDFLKLLSAGLLQINSGKTAPITLKNVNTPVKPSESIKSGNIYKAGYLDLAKRVNAFIDANGRLPNYTSSNLGKLTYESLIYMFSRVLNFQKENNRLPNYVAVKPWSTIGTSSTGGTTPVPVPAELQQYLKATSNCQVTNAQIKSLTASITNGKTSTYDKAAAIFNWVRNNIGYSFYYNTKKGATGTLSAKTANCCDTAHLLIALQRAAGIPARYVHANAKFTSGNTYGHVWAEVYVNGKWYTADATSSRNTFGVVKSWTSATIKGRYASLPF